MRRARGFSLAELMVALVVAGIIGVALTRLLINQSRFVAAQNGYMQARAAARAGFNVLVTELRMVTFGGLVAAAADSITARVPYAFGLLCGRPSGGWQSIALLPMDSANFASAFLGGWAWRDSTATWRFRPLAIHFTVTTDDCFPATDSAVALVPNGKRIRIFPNDPAAEAGSPAYLFQQVTYRIGASSQVPGRLALWRRAGLWAAEELVVPFDSASSFRFLVGGALADQTAAPASLDSIKGIRLRLIGQSEARPEGRSDVTEFDLTTDIVFMNRVR